MSNFLVSGKLESKTRIFSQSKKIPANIQIKTQQKETQEKTRKAPKKREKNANSAKKEKKTPKITKNPRLCFLPPLLTLFKQTEHKPWEGERTASRGRQAAVCWVAVNKCVGPHSCHTRHGRGEGGIYMRACGVVHHKAEP